MEQARINLDFDGTIKKGGAIKDFARICNDPKRAYGMATELFQDSVEIVKSSYSLDRLVDEIESLYESRMKEAAKLMRGVPVSSMMEIKCEPNTELLSEIFSMSGGRPVNIISQNDTRKILDFVKRENIPVHEIRGCRLGDCNGIFDGTLQYDMPKSAAPPGIAFGDQLSDLGLLKSAVKNGYRAFVVRNGKGSDLLESTLERYELDYGVFYNGKLTYNMSSSIMNPIAIPKM